MRGAFASMPAVLLLACATPAPATRVAEGPQGQVNDVVQPAAPATAPERKLPPRSRFPQGDQISKEPCVAAVTAPETLAVPWAGTERPIVVHVGDMLCLERAEQGQWRPVARAEWPTPHLAVKMTADDRMVMLRVHNASELLINYKAAMHMRGQWAPTTIVPVYPQISGVETWPDPLDALALYAITATEYPRD